MICFNCSSKCGMIVDEPCSIAGRLFQTSGPQTEKARLPNCVLVRQTTADLVDKERSLLTTTGVTDAKYNEVVKVWRRTLMENVVHDRSNFEHDSELDR